MRIVAPITQEGGPRIPQNPIFLKKRKKSSKTQKLKNIQKYAKISDTLFDQRSLIHREAWFPGGPRIPKNPFFFKRKKSSETQKLKNVQRYAKISDTPFDQKSLIRREAWFPPCFVRQNQQKKTFFARRFQTTSKQKCSNVRPLLSITFPQRFRISKNIGHPTSGSGGKKTVKRYLKSEQTDKQTDKHTDGQTHRRTFRLIKSIGPEGRCFENIYVIFLMLHVKLTYMTFHMLHVTSTFFQQFRSLALTVQEWCFFEEFKENQD